MLPHLLFILGSIFLVSPIAGLLGTVIQMVAAFSTMKETMDDAAQMAEQIQNALVIYKTTAPFYLPGILLLYISHKLRFTKGQREPDVSDLDYRSTALFCCFLGGFGAHRFYAGKVGSAVLYLFTLGFFGIGPIIDFINLSRGRFTDKEGKRIIYWQKGVSCE